MIALGWVDAASFRRGNDAFYAHYRPAGSTSTPTSPSRPRRCARAARPSAPAAHARFMREVIAPALRAEAQALVEAHRERGDRLALVTSTNDFVTAPIADAFAIDDLIATRLERDADGRRPAASTACRPFARARSRVSDNGWRRAAPAGADFERISVYSDSLNDLALLEQATDPVATNPSPELEASRARAAGAS